ncbi:hypothetical protein KUF57_12405 [Mycolicibacterium sp. PAM1]|nr:hypothetical protein [Mycolicibacterium sp. PAM1]
MLAALAAAVPPLHGSRCRGRADLFDATIDGQRGHHDDTLTARAAALAICGTCPALQPCRAWFDRLDPAQRPLGVIAGQLVTASA